MAIALPFKPRGGTLRSEEDLPLQSEEDMHHQNCFVGEDFLVKLVKLSFIVIPIHVYTVERNVVKSSHLYLYSAFNNTNCVKATAQYQNRKIVSQ